MADVVDAVTRSRMMSGIKGKDTRPEILVRQYLHARGFRFRLHSKTLAGRPDLVLPRFKAVIFVNGCFWHAHDGCRYFRLPATRPEFWEAKLLGNRARDQRTAELLLSQGWRVAIIWECGVRADSSTLELLCDWLAFGSERAEYPLTGFARIP